LEVRIYEAFLSFLYFNFIKIFIKQPNINFLKSNILILNIIQFSDMKFLQINYDVAAVNIISLILISFFSLFYLAQFIFFISNVKKFLIIFNNKNKNKNENEKENKNDDHKKLNLDLEYK
jgi:hypothetical protein